MRPLILWYAFHLMVSLTESVKAEDAEFVEEVGGHEAHAYAAIRNYVAVRIQRLLNKGDETSLRLAYRLLGDLNKMCLIIWGMGKILYSIHDREGHADQLLLIKYGGTPNEQKEVVSA